MTQNAIGTAKQEEVVDTVDIPADVFVQCPKESMALVPGTTCEACEHFHGLNIRMDGPTIAFASKYTSLCRWPQQRAFFTVKLPNASSK